MLRGQGAPQLQEAEVLVAIRYPFPWHAAATMQSWV